MDEDGWEIVLDPEAIIQADWEYLFVGRNWALTACEGFRVGNGAGYYRRSKVDVYAEHQAYLVAIGVEKE